MNPNPSDIEWREHLSELMQRRPVAVALAGPNGAGKSTLYEHLLAPAGLPFVNADLIAKAQGWVGTEQGSMAAAKQAESTRTALILNRESFVFETVFSDPVGDKLQQMQALETAGWAFVLIFVGLASPALSQARVIGRVLDGGHDVPDDRIQLRYQRTLRNLGAALDTLREVIVLDNSDDQTPYRCIAVRAEGKLLYRAKPLPLWAKPILSPEDH